MDLVIRHTLEIPGELYTDAESIARYVERLSSPVSFEPFPTEGDLHTVSAWIRRNKHLVRYPVGELRQGGPYITIGAITEK